MNLLAGNREVALSNTGQKSIGLGPLRKGLNNRRMGDIRGGLGAIGCRKNLKLIEIGPPLIGH